MTEFDGTELVHWRELPPAQRRGWWEYVWDAATVLSARYRLALRSGWWEDSVQVEAIAAFHAWLRLYDTGAYTDPPGKLQLLWELERLRVVLRAGEAAFDPRADRSSFELHLSMVDGDSPPPEHDAGISGRPTAAQATAELTAVTQRLSELRERRGLLEAQSSYRHHSVEGRQREQELARVRAAIADLGLRERTLRARVTPPDASAAPC